MSLFQFFKSAQQIELTPMIALEGEDSWIKERLRKVWTEQVLEKSLAEMNLSKFYAGEGGLSEVLQTCREYPCFASRRLVFLLEADKIKKVESGALIQYLQAPSETTTLILEANHFDGRLDWVKALKKSPQFLTIPALTQEEAFSWAQKHFRQQQKDIDAECLERLIEYKGLSLQNLQIAIDQICCFVGEERKITLACLDALMVKAVSENIFEMIEDLFLGNVVEMQRKVGSLLEFGEAPLKILSLIYRHLAILLSIRFSEQSQVATKTFNLYPKIFTRYEAQTKRYWKKLRPGLLHPMTEMDLKFKSSSLPPRRLLLHGMEELVRLLA